VRRAGREQSLRRKTFLVLLHLVQNRGRVVTREELQAAVWGDVVVTDDAVVQCIVEIRKALGDDPKIPRFVRTMPKAGYRFIGVVDEAPSRAHAIAIEAVTSVEIEYDEVVAARRSEAGPAGARRHGTLIAAGTAAAIAVGVLVVALRHGPPRAARSPADPAAARLAAALTENVEAYRLYTLAVGQAEALHNEEAIRLLERAVSLDPDFAMAWARIGYVHAITWSDPSKGRPFLEKAFRLSGRLTEKDRLTISAW